MTCIEIDNWLDYMTEFSRYCAYITYVPQTIGFLPRFYRAPLLIGFGRCCSRKTKLWNIIRLDMAYCPSLCKFEIILTLCFLLNFNSQFNSVLNSTFIVIQQYSWYFLFIHFRLKHHYQIKVITFDVRSTVGTYMNNKMKNKKTTEPKQFQ
jgi:hypothetical protein